MIVLFLLFWIISGSQSYKKWTKVENALRDKIGGILLHSSLFRWPSLTDWLAYVLVTLKYDKELLSERAREVSGDNLAELIHT